MYEKKIVANMSGAISMIVMEAHISEDVLQANIPVAMVVGGRLLFSDLPILVNVAAGAIVNAGKVTGGHCTKYMNTDFCSGFLSELSGNMDIMSCNNMV